VRPRSKNEGLLFGGLRCTFCEYAAAPNSKAATVADTNFVVKVFIDLLRVKFCCYRFVLCGLTHVTADIRSTAIHLAFVAVLSRGGELRLAVSSK
jgi:hypothetical protein